MRSFYKIIVTIMFILGNVACDRHPTNSIEEPTNITFLGRQSWERFPTGRSQRVQVDNWCYVLNDRTLITFDISQSASPRIINKTAMDKFIYGMTADSVNVYMSSSDDIEVYAVSESGELQFIGSCFVCDLEPFRMVTQGDKLFWINIFAFGILDISNPTQPTSIGGSGISGTITDIVIADNYVYLWSKRSPYMGIGGLHVFDISDPYNPILATSITSIDYFYDASLQCLGEYLYVTKYNGTDIYDISTPADPTLLTTLEKPSSSDITEIVDENYLYTRSNSTISVNDVTNPIDPIQKKETSLSFKPDGISILNDRLVASNYNELVILSLTNPAAPMELSNFQLRHAYNICSGDSTGMMADGHLGLLKVTQWWTGQNHSPSRGEAKDVVIEGNEYLYVADGDSGLTVFQADYISTQIGFLNLDGNCCVVKLGGKFCYLGTANGLLHITDITNRTAPALVNSINLTHPISDIAIIDSIAVVACGTGGLKIVNIADPLSPTVLHTLIGSAAISHVLATGSQIFFIEQGVGLYVLDITDSAGPPEPQEIINGFNIFNEDDGDMAPYEQYILAGTGSVVYLIDSNDPLTGLMSQNIGTDYCRSLAILSGHQSLTFLDDDCVNHYNITLPAK